MDIEDDCEPAVHALKSWIDAIETGDIDRLENLLSEDFVATCDPMIGGGRIHKAQFIAYDRHIRESKIDIVKLVARRHGNTIITLLFANIMEQFEGDLGSSMPTSAELSSFLAQSPVAYSSAWSLEADSQWRCVQHHIFGPVS
jgi:ketosteroid isomerase-like protein